jgi:hypothetical protein
VLFSRLMTHSVFIRDEIRRRKNDGGTFTAIAQSWSISQLTRCSNFRSDSTSGFSISLLRTRASLLRRLSSRSPRATSIGNGRSGLFGSWLGLFSFLLVGHLGLQRLEADATVARGRRGRRRSGRRARARGTLSGFLGFLVLLEEKLSLLLLLDTRWGDNHGR